MACVGADVKVMTGGMSPNRAQTRRCLPPLMGRDRRRSRQGGAVGRSPAAGDYPNARATFLQEGTAPSIPWPPQAGLGRLVKDRPSAARR